MPVPYPAIDFMRRSMQMSFAAFEAQMTLACAMMRLARQMNPAFALATGGMVLAEKTPEPAATRAEPAPPAAPRNLARAASH